MKEAKLESGKKVWVLEKKEEQMKGMMFKEYSDPMLFVLSCGRIRNMFHTWFMKFDLDFYFLNEKMEVVDIQKDVKPWRFVIPRKKCCYCLEAKAGEIKFEIGQRVVLL